MKKLFCIILSSLMLLSLPTALCSVEALDCGGIQYSYDGDNITITGYTGEEVDTLTIPDSIGGGNVTKIAQSAFKNSSLFSEVIIPESVTEMGKEAFKNCSKLKKVTLGGGVETIPERAFESCKALESINLSAGVKTISSYAFSGCKGLKVITVPGNVKTVSSYAFYQCSGAEKVELQSGVEKIINNAFRACAALESVVISDTVNSIGTYAFASDQAVTSVIISEENEYYDSRDNCNAIINSKSNTLIEGFNCSSIPDGVISIAPEAYGGLKGVEEITIGKDVTTIGYNAFANSSIKTFRLNAKTENIGVCILSGCNNLETITVDANNKHFTSMDSNIIVRKSDGYLIQGCPGSTIPEGVKGIEANAFKNMSSIINISLPGSLRYIGEDAFAGCSSLAEIKIPSGVRNISAKFLDGCENLTRITINAGVTIKEGVDFTYGCKNVKEMTIPSSVGALRESFFGSDKGSLEKINFYGPENLVSLPKDWNIEVSTLEGTFKDVDGGDYFFIPVCYAVENNVTTGTSPDSFSPSSDCTRGQIVTFLYRAAGEPEVKEAKNPFKDVKESDYYYNAVLWAVENGITKGLSSDLFGPGLSCTRAQAVTFLYRAASSPTADYSYNVFVDVKGGSYYRDSVCWAVEWEITNGMDDIHFKPDSTCNRAQIVTFIFRYISTSGQFEYIKEN